MSLTQTSNRLPCAELTEGLFIGPLRVFCRQLEPGTLTLGSMPIEAYVHQTWCESQGRCHILRAHFFAALLDLSTVEKRNHLWAQKTVSRAHPRHARSPPGGQDYAASSEHLAEQKRIADGARPLESYPCSKAFLLGLGSGIKPMRSQCFHENSSAMAEKSKVGFHITSAKHA